MKRAPLSILAAATLPASVLLLGVMSQQAASHTDHDGGGADEKGLFVISQSAMLTGLPSQALFPFIDVTPNQIRRAHIAITDSTDNCAGPGSGAPRNVQILVGEAGGALTPVMTAATNTGISNKPGQCVFHVTIKAGAGEIPSRVTDIVVVNVGGSTLRASNTITAFAEVARRKGDGPHQH